MKFSTNRTRTRPSATSEQWQNQNSNQIRMKTIAMALSTCLTKWVCFNGVFEDQSLQNLFSQWVCFNGVIKVNLFNERVQHSEPASMTCLKIDLFRTCSVSESASMTFSSWHLLLPLYTLSVQSICIAENMNCDQSLL